MKYKFLSVFLILLISGSIFIMIYFNNMNKKYDNISNTIDKKIVDIKKNISDNKTKLNKLKEDNDKKNKINQNTDQYIKMLKEKLNEK